MGLDIHPLADDHADDAFQLRAQAFNLDRERFDLFWDWRRMERTLGAFDAGRLVATAHVHELGQWLGGRVVPMGGLASVAVAADRRGRGVASRLVAAALEAMRDRGEVISTLYPATTIPYRRLGWEVAGTRVRRRVPLRSLAHLPAASAAVRLRPADADGDLTALRAVYDQVAPTTDGFVARNERWWGYHLRRALSAGGDPGHAYVYLAESTAGDPVGYLIYHHGEGAADEFYGLEVDELLAVDPEANLALWRLLAGNRGVSANAVYAGSPEDPLTFLLPEQDTRTVADWRWMTRLVDAPAAVAARGYPEGVDAAVHLQIADQQASWNAGRWVLQVRGGKGVLEPGGTGEIGLTVNALAPLYTGLATPWSLARHGLLTGGSAADLRALAAAFAGPPPWMVEFF
jgi:predicted acetyltransferase